jgi:lipopolysaccharide export LptBFGC system permease protein LptF
MRKNRVFLISVVVFLIIFALFVFSKYREPISDQRKKLVDYFLTSPTSTPSPSSTIGPKYYIKNNNDRINYIKNMDLNDGEYTAILKDKDKNDETKVNELKKLVKKNDN